MNASIVTDRAARHSSISNEHYTPPEVISVVHKVMRGIDLDPASCALANTVVQATTIYTIEDDGLRKPWSGRVFLNPPGGKCDETGLGEGNLSRDKLWWRKLTTEYAAGRVYAAMFMGFSIELLQKAQDTDPSPLDFPLCIPRSRIKFLNDADGRLQPGKSPTHGNVIIFLPPRDEQRVAMLTRFYAFASEVGCCGQLQETY